MAGPEREARTTEARRISDAALRALGRQIILARLSLLTERVLQCFWPAASLLALGSGLVRWGLLGALGQTALLAVLAGFVAGFLFLLVRGAERFRFPTRKAAIDRLDAALEGRPLGTLDDRQAVGAGDAGSEYVWAMHLKRMAEAARNARATEPKPQLSKRDPWALRLMALLVFVSALVFASGRQGQSLMDSLQGLPADAVAGGGPAYEGWAEPPGYTGKPTIYLNEFPEGKPLDLPEGTRVILRVYGSANAATLRESVSAAGGTAMPETDTGLSEVEFEVARDGDMTVSPRGSDPVGWQVRMIPDQVPTVELSGEISRSLQGSMQIPYKAEDDYGIEGGTVEVQLDMDRVDRRHGLAADPEPREPLSFSVQLPIRGDLALVEETIVEELAEHPWAGLPVRISLNVYDAANNVGAIEPVSIEMPGKRFFDDLAGSVAEQRRDLLWTRGNAKRVGMILKAVTHRPEDIFQNDKAYLMVRTAIRRLDYNAATPLSDEVRDEVAELLWKAALLIEDGDLSDAAERLKRAQERLSEAMENGATDEEIQELMDELRRAAQDYMRQLAENAERNPDRQQSQIDPSQMVTQDQLQELMNRIQELMEQGRMDEAQQLLQQLQQMLENMQVVQGGQGQSGEQAGRQGLQDTLREQQDLADETFREMQEEFNRQRQQDGNQEDGQQLGQQQDQQQGGQGERPGDQQQGQQQGQQPGEGGSGLGDLAQRQEALRRMLQSQRGQLPQDGSEAGRAGREALDQAERQMGEARDRLERGDASGALDNQADAIDALREGLRNMDEAARQAERQNGQQQGDGNGPVTGQVRRDPLGRPLGGNGAPSTDENMVPDEELYRRSKELRDEIRKRTGEQDRPQLELDYLKRLLERF
jgi:uncharacterized protein (TIGR02302 family)